MKLNRNKIHIPFNESSLFTRFCIAGYIFESIKDSTNTYRVFHHTHSVGVDDDVCVAEAHTISAVTNKLISFVEKEISKWE